MPHKLLCPRCEAKIAVGDDAGGRTVRCPKCEDTFVVPGFASSSAGDAEDWLTMGSVPRSPAEAPSRQPNQHQSAEPDWLQMDFPAVPDAADTVMFPLAAAKSTSSTSGPTSKTPPVPSVSDDITAELSQAAPPRPVQYESEYRVRCPNCQTVIGVHANQSGKAVRCHDCHTPVRVPPPPRKKIKPEIDLAEAATFRFNPSVATQSDRAPDPFRKSAAELMAAAEQAETELTVDNSDLPSIGGWFDAVFGIYRQISVCLHWILLSMFASLFASAAIAYGQAFVLIILIPSSILFAAMVLASGFVIMESVSNQEPAVGEWPQFSDPAEWLSPAAYCLIAAAMSGGPGTLLGSLLFGVSLTTTLLTMLTLFAAFPFILLSMLDSNSPLVPFSADVSRSFNRCAEAWGGFYFSSGLIFFVCFMIFVAASLMAGPVAPTIYVFAAVGTTFLYFAMLGRLAFSIGNVLNVPTRTDEADSSDEENPSRER